MKLTTCSLSPLFDFYSSERPINWEGVFKRQAPVHVEIGFGMGEVLLRKAQDYPGIDFVGIEFNWERIYKTIKAIDRLNCSRKVQDRICNVQILRIDARVAFERLFNIESIDHIYALFPCPWPKKSHIKNRLFSNAFLTLLNSRLKEKGSLQIVTDYYPYFEWIKEQTDKEDFQVQADGIKPQFGTKFERKWLEEGQQEFFELTLLKQKHINCVVKEDIEVKAYKVNEFDPENFKFEEFKGDVAVILKDQIFDGVKNQMMIRVIVNEQHLMQNFWAMIRKDKGFWRICKVEGQHFFPTPGINKALEVIYHAAEKSSAPVQ